MYPGVEWEHRLPSWSLDEKKIVHMHRSTHNLILGHHQIIPGKQYCIKYHLIRNNQNVESPQMWDKTVLQSQGAKGVGGATTAAESLREHDAEAQKTSERKRLGILVMYKLYLTMYSVGATIMANTVH